jgi:exopolysaccharide biosynthesis protein
VETTEPTEPTEPDLRTEWQKKFEDKFTDEVVMTDNSYTSPTVSITIHTMASKENGRPLTYYLADIYVASLDNFRSRFAYGEYRPYGAQDAVSLSKDANAILAISGDFYAYQATGFLMRNGYLYRSDPTFCDVCVLYDDGVMETYSKNGYNQQEVLDRGAVQVWNFGPNLLDENGKVCKSFNMDDHVTARNPRSAIGYYEPGHYCLVVVDGREYDYAAGVLIPDLAKIFEDLGCKVAYNLDGGGSACMTFNDAYHSVPSEIRALSDLVIVVDGPPAEQED